MKIDVGMLDSQVAILENAIARHVATGDIPGRWARVIRSIWHLVAALRQRTGMSSLP